MGYALLSILFRNLVHCAIKFKSLKSVLSDECIMAKCEMISCNHAVILCTKLSYLFVNHRLHSNTIKRSFT